MVKQTTSNMPLSSSSASPQRNTAALAVIAKPKKRKQANPKGKAKAKVVPAAAQAKPLVRAEVQSHEVVEPDKVQRRGVQAGTVRGSYNVFDNNPKCDICERMFTKCIGQKGAPTAE